VVINNQSMACSFTPTLGPLLKVFARVRFEQATDGRQSPN
jgi:hypothetical protein